MEHELKDVLHGRFDSSNLNAAISAQMGSTRDPKLLTVNGHYISRTFQEGGYDFHIHLHSSADKNSHDLTSQHEMPPDQQRAILLEYVRRREIDVLIVNAVPSKPLFGLYPTRDNMPQMLLQELLLILSEKYISTGSAQSGMVVLSTGVLEGYAHRLEAYLLELAHLHHMDPLFMDWIEEANLFRNSLEEHVFKLNHVAGIQQPPLFKATHIHNSDRA